VLEAMREVPRAGFVPGELVERAYVDEPLRIPHGQVTTQPSLVARMVEALELGGRETVLEVGTGHGAIVVAAAFPQVPEPLAEQLAPGGRLVHPVGPGGAEDVALFEKAGRELVRRRTIVGAHFVRLVGERGFIE
jgi:protein-L-isoaspartate(D-aspartate) O-methyltransferase